MSFNMKLVTAVVALAILASCGSTRSGPGPVASAIGSFAKDTFSKGNAEKTAGKASGKSVSPAERRAKLAEAGEPVLRVSSKALGQTSFAKLVDTKGQVQTWGASGATFSLRGGVLIQTRGLGADLMSAQAPSIAQLSQGGARYQRIYYFLGGDDQGTRRTYDCSTETLGRESIEVVGRSHATTHVRETCLRPPGKVTNDYWIEGATIRKSRQWVSAGVGHVEFERVID